MTVAIETFPADVPDETILEWLQKLPGKVVAVETNTFRVPSVTDANGREIVPPHDKLRVIVTYEERPLTE